MALPKLFDLITWHNNTTPALNEDNLNAMSQAIDDIDDRVIDLAGTIMEDVPQIIEDMEILEPAIESIDENVAAAEADKLEAEGFAVGEQNGVPVDSSSPYYHNNAKYYSQVAPPTAAAHVSYDNSQSHLVATNVQGAVDELNEALTDLTEYVTETGVKNLLPNTAVSTTSGGLTITKNDDGSVHISGTRGSGDYYCQINDAPVLKDTNNYILSGITGGSSTTYQMVVQDFVNNTNLGILYDGDRDFSATANGVKVFIVIRSGQTIDKTFYPMIRPASITDPTYQPYAANNQKLTGAALGTSKGEFTYSGCKFYYKAFTDHIVLATTSNFDPVPALADWTTVATLAPGLIGAVCIGTIVTADGSIIKVRYINTTGALEFRKTVTGSGASTYVNDTCIIWNAAL